MDRQEGWMPWRHLLLVNEALLRIARGELRRLMVFMPPRHGKSMFLSEYATGWFVGALGWEVMLASYEADFAASWGMRSRDHIKAHGHDVFGVHIQGRDQEKWWEVDNGGSMRSMGVGGPATGKGGRLLVIDDPVKNAEEADSDVMRDKAANWYDSTWYTRREPGCAEIVMQTRWHEVDLSGYLLQKEDDPEPWEVISLPALADSPDDLLDRQEGEALCPQRYDKPTLQGMKLAMPPRWWNAMYQQKPTADEGAIFPRANWMPYDVLPQLERGCITIDTAGWQKKDTSADYCAISAWGVLGANHYLAETMRGHWEFDEVKQRAIDLHLKWLWPVVVEETSWALPLIQELKKILPGTHGEKPVLSKENRARAVNDIQKALQAHIPRSAPWRSDWIEEHVQFPNGQHDDWVDNTTLAWKFLRDGWGTVKADTNKNRKAYQATIGKVRA